MSQRVLVDTGPLVASINKSDRFHEWANVRLGRAELPLLTCEAVLVEVYYLTGKASIAILEMIERRIIEIPFHVEEHTQEIVRQMKRYADLPMSFTDACLVRMSEVYNDAMVLTCDCHFRIYRKHGRQAIPVLMPPD